LALHRYTTQIGAGGVSAAEALAGATAETVIQLLTPSTRKAQVIEIGIGFDSVTASNVPATVELLLQTTAGTGTSITPDPTDPGMPAALVTAQHHFTAEPTASTIRWATTMPVVGGLLIYQLPLDREIIMAVSTRLGLRITSPSAVNVRGYIMHEE
jgi:hypothetical protein